MSPLGGGATDVAALTEYGETTPGHRSNMAPPIVRAVPSRSSPERSGDRPA